MKKNLLAALFLIFSNIPAMAALTVVQHGANRSTANSAQISITVTSTGSNNLLVAGTGNSDTRTVSSVSDGTNNFTQATSAAGTDATYQSDVWYLLKSISGKTTITVTFSGAASTFSKEVWFWEVSGFSSVVYDLGNNVTNGVQSGGSATGASVTTTGTTGFIVGIDKTQGSVTVNPKAGNEFTSGGDINSVSDAGCSLISSTAAAHQPVWTDNGTDFCSSTAAFKEGNHTNLINGVSVINGVSILR